MAWAKGFTSTAPARHLLEYIEHLGCSKTVASLVKNAGGTGYSDGDELKVVGQYLDCIFIVSAAAGAVTGIKRIKDNGAFTNRLTAATVTAGNAGTGYAIGDIVSVLGGTLTAPAKLRVGNVGGAGAVTLLTVYEGGGSYTTPPSNGASTDSTIGLGVGTGLKVDMTFSGTPSINNVASIAISGAGTGATFDLTLVDNGWSVLKSANNYTSNAVLDEKEVVLQGTGGTGSANPIIGFRTGTEGGGPNHVFLSISPMTAYNSLLAYDAQLNILNPVPGTTGGQYIQFEPAVASTYYFSIAPRYISGHVKGVGGITAWHSFAVGLADPSKTVVEQPFPLFVIGSCSSIAVDFDEADEIEISGLTELHRNSARFGPAYIWDQDGLAWAEMVHGESASASPPWTVLHDRGITPLFEPRVNFTGTANKGQTVADGPCNFFGTIGRADGDTPTHSLKPTPDTGGDKQALHDCILTHSLDVAGITDGGMDGRLPNVFWFSAKKEDGSLMVAEDVISFGDERWVVFPNGARNEAYSFFARKQGT